MAHKQSKGIRPPDFMKSVFLHPIVGKSRARNNPELTFAAQKFNATCRPSQSGSIQARHTFHIFRLQMNDFRLQKCVRIPPALPVVLHLFGGDNGKECGAFYGRSRYQFASQHYSVEMGFRSRRPSSSERVKHNTLKFP